MKNIRDLHEIIRRSEFNTKIQISFASKTAGADFDPYSKNYTLTNLAPITIKGLVRQVSMSSLVWKQYGLSQTGAVEVITEAKYKKWFENASRILIDEEDYSVFREAVGSRAMITKLANNLIKVALNKK